MGPPHVASTNQTDSHRHVGNLLHCSITGLYRCATLGRHGCHGRRIFQSVLGRFSIWNRSHNLSFTHIRHPLSNTSYRQHQTPHRDPPITPGRGLGVAEVATMRHAWAVWMLRGVVLRLATPGRCAGQKGCGNLLGTSHSRTFVASRKRRKVANWMA